MKKSKFTEEQIAYALRQVESGTAPADVCRQLGVSEATFYIWKKKYAHLGASELRKLRSLEDEDSRLKRLVAGSKGCSSGCGCDGASTSPCIAGQPRRPRGQRSDGVWTSFTTPSPTGGRFAS